MNRLFITGGVFAIIIAISTAIYFQKSMHSHTHTSSALRDITTENQSIHYSKQLANIGSKTIQEASENDLVNHKYLNSGLHYEGDYLADTVSQVENNSEYARELVSMYIEGRGDDLILISKLSYLISFTEDGEHLEQFITDQLFNSSGEDQEKWAELLGAIGVRNASSHQVLIDSFPILGTDTALASVITALLPVHVLEAERVNIMAHIEPYVKHSNNEIRSAATLTGSLWGDPIQTVSILESSISDESVDVRFASATAATLVDVQSPILKNSMLSRVIDKSEHIDVREQSLQALANYDLTEQENQIVQEYLKERDDIFTNLNP